MEKFIHLLILCGLLNTLSWARPNADNRQVTPTAPGQSWHSTESLLSNPSSNSSTQNVTESFVTPNVTPSSDNLQNATIPTMRISANSTSANMQSNSTVLSSTSQTTITTVQTNQSTTSTIATSLTTQHGSETTTSVSTASASPPAVTGHGNGSTPNTEAPHLTTEVTHGNKTVNETSGTGLSISEKSMTMVFSVVLGVIVLIVLGQTVYRVSRNKRRTVQYSHRPLYNEDTGEQFMMPDDTLVISGGLYDGPQIYNPTVTGLNDEEQPGFAYAPTQLRLEFLHEEQETDRDYEGTSFETFKKTDEKP